MQDMRKKIILLTGYMEFLIHETAALQKKEGPNGKSLEIITPADPERRGCQLSMVANGFGKKLHTDWLAHGVVSDWREPNVIRFAPVPLYNSFEDVFQFSVILKGLVLQQTSLGNI
jgi:kynureninase